MKRKLRVLLLRFMVAEMHIEVKCLSRWLHGYLKPLAEDCVRNAQELRQLRKEHYEVQVESFKLAFEAWMAKFVLLQVPTNPRAKLSSDLELEKGVMHARAQSLIAEIRALPPIVAPGTNFALNLLHGAQHAHFALRDRLSTVQQLAHDIDSPHFYTTLILSFLLPVRSGQALIGDLEEEYVAICKAKGADIAGAWYTKQAMSSIRSGVLQILGTLAALITIGDAIKRLLKGH